ncbi:HlyD family efflux transporter periplasmic adaptor subunit [Ancylomarina salipaludis]|uniref:HlyD family efflux transporter periplasmic adaptor subunit n=1 Tax=Ancylomarina salipaludis TaxID=2501299 RepID=A0A4V1N0I5_9BACT|nr:HlyD family efflux transporter periplasmic adaptor subunit [Ancylomarina salipaludis]RXQ97397.1 HlyD family efflux transporter periplasmic adaptor subunit [Ancylomarina salipaludis]
MKLKKNDPFQGRSEVVQEVLGHAPNKIIIRSNLVMFIIILVLIIACFFIKYPDSIEARATLLSYSPPIEVVAKSSGKLCHLFYKDGDFVDANGLIGVIESATSFRDVMDLKVLLDTIDSTFRSRNNKLNNNFNLGSMHVHYSTFVKRLNKLIDFKQDIKLRVQIDGFEKQKQNSERYKQNLQKQFDILSDEIEIRNKWYRRDSILFQGDFISSNTFETSKLQFVSNQKALHSAIGQILQVAGEEKMIDNKILEITAEYKDRLRQLIADVEESYIILKSQIDIWEELYLLKAPISGKLTFTNVWSKEQYINVREKVFTIVPTDDNVIVGRVLIPVSGAGKVKKGQSVILRLDSYPYMEYGFINAKLEKFSLVPVNEGGIFYYIGEIQLPDRMVSNYGNDLPFIQKLQGNAEIMVNKKRLIERFYEPIKNIINK